jgi:hypothetical protein
VSTVQVHARPGGSPETNVTHGNRRKI